MASEHGTTELALTLRISPEAKDKIVQRATSSGKELGEYVSGIVEQAAGKPLDLEAISGPVYQRFLESGITEDELAEELEEAKHRMRAERHARQGQ